jgi:hypothetical protein
MRDRFNETENTMSVAYITGAKTMARFLLKREHRGPGDTIEAASHRLQTKFKVPASIIMRLWNRPVNDMLLSNFVALAVAYMKAKYATASEKIEKAYEDEKALAVNPTILRLAAALAGEEVGDDEEGEGA